MPRHASGHTHDPAVCGTARGGPKIGYRETSARRWAEMLDGTSQRPLAARGEWKLEGGIGKQEGPPEGGPLQSRVEDQSNVLS